MPILRPMIISGPTGATLLSEGGIRTFVSVPGPNGAMAVHFDEPSTAQAFDDVSSRFAEVAVMGEGGQRISLFANGPNKIAQKWVPPSVKALANTLFYDDGCLEFKRGYPASNEYDLFRQPIDQREAEVFVGLGNNSVWDLAVRRNAKQMIIGDRDEQVIMFQEFLYRPLLEISGSPAEFVSLLAGVPFLPRLIDAPLDEVFEYVDQCLDRYEAVGIRPKHERLEYISGIADRVRAHAGLTEEHAAFVEKHLKWIARPERSHEHGFAGPASPILTLEERDDPYLLFRNRYYPKKLLKKGADPAVIGHPFFSFLSSREAFERLQGLFGSGRVSYFVGDIADPRAYEEVGKMLRGAGLRISGFSMTNIVDCLASDDNLATSLTVRILEMVMREVDVDPSFTVYHTRQTRSPHIFEVYQVSDDPQRISLELERIGHNISAIERRSDFQFAVETIENARPEIIESGMYGVCLRFENGLHIYFNSADRISFSHIALDHSGELLSSDDLAISTAAEKSFLDKLALSKLMDIGVQANRIKAFLKFNKIG